MDAVMLTPVQLQTALVLGPALIGLAGCASPVDRRPPGAYVGESGAGWAVVFPSTEIAGGPAPETTPEFVRRDYALGMASAADLPPGSWPDYTLASLAHQRRLNLPRRAETIIYFRPHEQHYHR